MILCSSEINNPDMAEFVNKGRYDSIIVHVLENGRNRNLTFQKYWEHVR